jgi:acyl-CoA thioester hydrolase
MFTSETKLRVRYAETDQMGYVYYGNYAQYYEVGRVDALRLLGLTYRQFEESGVMMPVLKLACTYIKPAKYDDLLTVKTIIRELPGIRIHFDYEIYSDDGVLLNKGETTLAFVDMKTMRPVKCPPLLYDRMKEYYR